MASRFTYHVEPDPDGWGWLVAAEGYVVRSLPYDTKDEAIFMAGELVREHPGSRVVVDDHPRALTPFEIESRLSP